MTCRCFCSLYKDSTTGKGQSAAEDTQVPAQHEKLQWEEKVDKFMSNLSEKHLLEKKQLELEIKMMSQMNASVSIFYTRLTLIKLDKCLVFATSIEPGLPACL